MAQDFTYIQNTDVDIELRKLLLIFKRRWPSGLLILFISVILSALASATNKTQYEAVGKLLFKNDSTAELTGIQASINEFESLERNSNPIITEIEIIKSVPVAEKTIKDLKLNNEEGETMEASQLLNNLEVEPLVGTDVIQVSYVSDDPDLSKKITDRLIKNYINRGRNLNTESITKAYNLIVERQLPEAQKQVEVKENELQKFREKYQVFSLDKESEAMTETIRNVEQEIVEVEAQVEEVKAQSIKLQQQLGMDSQQATIWTKLAQSPTILKQVEDLLALQSELTKQKILFHDNHPTIVALKNQTIDLKKTVQQSINENLGTSPEISIVDLKKLEQKNLSPELTSSLLETEVEKERLTNRLKKLRQNKYRYTRTIAALPELVNQFKEIELQLETAQSNYKLLLKKSQELRLAKQQPMFDNVRIIESAQVYPVNFGPSFTISVVIGSFLGIMLGISAMVGIDLIDNLIKSPEEIAKIFNCKILGTIPDVTRLIKPISGRERILNYLEASTPSILRAQPRLINSQELALNNFDQKGEMLPVKDIPNSLSSKAFWMLQAKIKLLDQEHRDNSEKIVVVSSSLAQEGKSMVTANLALTLSQLGEKVLIVDGNLYQPRQHELWNINNSEGLSDVILNKKNVDSAIVSLNENLDLLPSGVINCNPLKIIDSMKTKQLMWELVEKYHLILIDSPALDEVPDALSLAKIADGMLLVARLDTLTYQGANKCKDLLGITGVNLMGLVVNNLN